MSQPPNGDQPQGLSWDKLKGEYSCRQIASELKTTLDKAIYQAPLFTKYLFVAKFMFWIYSLFSPNLN